MAIPMHERLKAVRTALKLSQRGISKEIYTVQSAYARMETGLQPINERTIELICYRYNVNRAYLRDGEDAPMFCEIPVDVKSGRLHEIFEELNGLFQDYLIVQAQELLKVQNRQEGQAKSPPGKKSRRGSSRGGGAG